LLFSRDSLGCGSACISVLWARSRCSVALATLRHDLVVMPFPLSYSITDALSTFLTYQEGKKEGVCSNAHCRDEVRVRTLSLFLFTMCTMWFLPTPHPPICFPSPMMSSSNTAEARCGAQPSLFFRPQLFFSCKWARGATRDSFACGRCRGAHLTTTKTENERP
jgi:hypothetical protein